jgi:hypothetical protein
MIYLVAGLDRSTLDRWHDHVMARDASGAARIARGRAAGQGVDLVVAAVVGPNSSIEDDVAATVYVQPRAA